MPASCRRRGPRIPIIATAAFIATLEVLAHGSGRALDPLGVLLAVLACFPLIVRRRAPLEVFVLTTAASATISLLGYHLGPPFGPTIALSFVAGDPRTRSRLTLTAAVVASMLAVLLGAAVLGQRVFPTTSILASAALWGGAWIMGDQVRQRRQRIADFREHAQRAERDTEREQRLAVAEERTRIARDLHDSAAHAINVILVQAGAARLLQEQDPDAVRRALSTIEDVARETIGDIDQMVRGLREPGGVVEPPIGLAAVDTLAERHREAGLATDVRREGTPRQLAPGVDQAAYRILQESLTNAARYGDGSADVQIEYGDRQLGLTVSNRISLPSVNGGGGHGILGMRERATLLGGSLDAGPSGGRFVVSALLPYGHASASPRPYPRGGHR
jgi:signal transduction histidine kinase